MYTAAAKYLYKHKLNVDSILFCDSLFVNAVRLNSIRKVWSDFKINLVGLRYDDIVVQQEQKNSDTTFKFLIKMWEQPLALY